MLRALDLLSQHHRHLMHHSPTAGPSTPPPTDQSPYFTPPRSAPHTRSRSSRSNPAKATTTTLGHAPPTPRSPTISACRSKRRKRVEPVVEIEVSAPATTFKSARAGRQSRKKRKNVDLPGHDPLTSDDTLNAVLATSEKGVVESIGKIHLIQERVRHDPWKMLVATCLLNVTSGRAARPIYIQLLSLWPTPTSLAQASVPDLTELLYPLGLFNQRASSLIRFSQQYLSLQWPLHPGTPSPDPFVHPTSPFTPEEIPEELDVRVFAGAGRYASDSFRIYSHLLAGGGAPEREGRWIEKRARALDRFHGRYSARGQGKTGFAEEEDREVEDPESTGEGLGVEDLGEYISDEEDVGEEEWRNVRPTDKELRRYLIWRWGLEGIVYDIHKGPLITRKRDKLRLTSHLDGS